MPSSGSLLRVLIPLRFRLWLELEGADAWDASQPLVQYNPTVQHIHVLERERRDPHGGVRHGGVLARVHR